MVRLKGFDLLALGFLTFALFLGAGNIIFPASAGLAAGDRLWSAAAGFLLTGVGLPLLTVVALARVGGGMPGLTAPLGRKAGVLLAVAVYLAVGPLFATPRTAVVSFEIGVVPFVGDSALALFIYTSLYFAAALFFVLSPGRLLDRVGKMVTPVLLLALLVLGGAALLMPAGAPGAASDSYREQPMLNGFLAGYLTMDALGALVFGVVIATAVRGRGITDLGLITRYTSIAGLIAAVGLSAVYLSLFYLGAGSHEVAQGAQNGGQVLTAYVEHTFGRGGILLLSVVILLACITTGVGLLVACGEFFSDLLRVPYTAVVWVFTLFSFAVSNIGLNQLISLSIPVLAGLYPLAIMLVVLSLLDRFWLSSARVMIPVMAVTLCFGMIDGFRSTGVDIALPWVLERLPLASLNLGWVVPVLSTLALAIMWDRAHGRPSLQERP